MDNKYLQGRTSLLSVSIDDNLYKLENGNFLFIQSLCDDPDYEYGYYYFDGKTKRLIDGGVFNIDAGSAKEVIEEALSWCDLSTEMTYELVEECADLEDLGFTGF